MTRRTMTRLLCLLWALLVATVATSMAGGQQSDDVPPERLASVNREPVAENILTRGRELLAQGDAAGAALMIATATRQFPDAVVPVDNRLHRPLWLTVIHELRTWSPEALAAYHKTIDPEATKLYRQAVAATDPQALERVATAYFMSSVGDRAAAALADRLKEAGRFAMACYYYDLVLTERPDSRIDANRLRTEALRCARLAGLEQRAAKFKHALAAKAPPADAATKPPVDRRLAQQSGGFDHVTTDAAIVPAAVAWVVPLTGQPLKSRYVAASTPLPTPVDDNGDILVTFQTRAWRIRAADGASLWHTDTAQRDDKDEPVYYFIEQAHRPLVADRMVIAPLSSGDATAAKARYCDRAGLVALSRADGHVLWQWNARQQGLPISTLAVDTLPVADAGHVFAAMTTAVGFFGELQTVALDRFTGRMLWHRPIAAHSSQVILRKADTASMPVVKPLALRGGVLLSSGGGQVSAQSATSGRILWTRLIPQRPKDRSVAPDGLPGLPGRPFDGQICGRTTQIVTHGSTVIAGGIVAEQLVACDLLTGRRLWTRTSPRANQPLASTGRLVIVWGRNVEARDIATGDIVWTCITPPAEIIAGTPLVTRGHVLIPTDRRLLAARLADGTIDFAMDWPEDRCAGNLLLARQGLVVAEPRALVMYHSWDVSQRRLTAAAKADAADPVPLIRLADAARRLGRFDRCTDLLSQAGKRIRNDAAASQVFEAQCRTLAAMDAPARHRFADGLFRSMSAAARGPAAIARLGLLEGRHYHDSAPARSLRGLHRVLASADLRSAGLPDDPSSPGPAGVQAERLIRRIVATHGSAMLAPWETRAARERRQALGNAASTASALKEVAMRFPATQVARASISDAADSLAARGQHDDAAGLLRQLANLSPGGPENWHCRLRLAHSLARAGRKDLARREAEKLSDVAPAGSQVTGPSGTVELHKALAPLLKGPLPATQWQCSPRLPPGSYVERWATVLSGAADAANTPTADYRSAAARARHPLVAANLAGLWALDRGTGRILWQHPFAPWQGERAVVPMLMTDALLIVGREGDVVALDPMTGQQQWCVPLQPPWQSDEASETLTGLVTHGKAIWSAAPAVQALRLDLDDGLIRVETMRSIHLLDIRTGRSASAFGNRTGKVPRGIYCRNGTAAGVCRGDTNTVTVWDVPTATPMPAWHSDHPIAALLCSGPRPGQLLVGYDDGSVALADLLGRKQLWQIADAAPRPGSRAACRLGNTMLVGSRDGRLVALDAATGKPRWTKQIGPSPNEAAMELIPCKRGVLVWAPRRVALMSPAGKVLWQQRFADSEMTTHVRPTRGRLLVLGVRRSHSGVIMFADTLDPQTGRRDGSTELAVPPGRLNVLPLDAGLLVAGPAMARLYTPDR
jgi:outer membrane protein assembly factor BamB